MNSIFENNFELNKAHHDSFFKSEKSDIIKGGFGSGPRSGANAGRLLGYVGDNKPVYANKRGYDYDNFSKEDHIAAAKLHDSEEERNKKIAKEETDKGNHNRASGYTDKAGEHNYASETHIRESKKPSKAELELDQKRKDTIAKIKDPSLKEGLKR